MGLSPGNIYLRPKPSLMPPTGKRHVKREVLPLLRPAPPKLSLHTQDLAAIEASGTYSNYGPVNSQLEQELVSTLFSVGECLTVCNATIGLMLAIREVIGEDRPAERKYALMPSFTFAATAHAALWCGLTPLFCDIDPETWLPSAESEYALLKQYAGEIAVIVPYATFGNNLDLPRYTKTSQEFNVPVVVDAAASLGSLDDRGKTFGSGFQWPIVFSMHATKAFSVGEGGIIYCADRDRVARLRCMGAFGFEQPRIATLAGLNSKLSEVSALTALLQLRRFPELIRERCAVSGLYRSELSSSFVLQRVSGQRQVRSFESVLLPAHPALNRAAILEKLGSMGVGAAHYFSPHLAEHPYFQRYAKQSSLRVTEDVAGRIISLPSLPEMTREDVRHVAGALQRATLHATAGFSTIRTRRDQLLHANAS